MQTHTLQLFKSEKGERARNTFCFSFVFPICWWLPSFLMNGRKTRNEQKKITVKQFSLSFLILLRAKIHIQIGRFGPERKKVLGCYRHTGLMLINVSCCFSSFSATWKRDCCRLLLLLCVGFAHISIPMLDDDGVHLHAFRSPMSNQSEANIT